MLAARKNEPPAANASSQDDKANGRHSTLPSKALESTNIAAMIERKANIDATLWILADPGSEPFAIGNMAASRTPTDHSVNKIRP